MITSKTIPFFGNHNGMSCGQCCYRMALSYIFPERNWSFQQMDDLCGATAGKYTWGYKPLTRLSDYGLQVVTYSTFDTNAFLRSPELYLTQRFGAEGCQDNLENSDIAAVLAQARDFLDYCARDKIRHIAKSYTPEIIKTLLQEEHLLIIWVNSKKLNKLGGYSGHFILAYDYDSEGIYAHDPGGNDENGLPVNQRANRYILYADLIDAACPKTKGETSSLTAIKRLT